MPCVMGAGLKPPPLERIGMARIVVRGPAYCIGADLRIGAAVM